MSPDVHPRRSLRSGMRWVVVTASGAALLGINSAIVIGGLPWPAGIVPFGGDPA